MHTPFRSTHHKREILVANWRDAEELAAWYMKERLELGFVRLTGNGADGGIDVISTEASAQVKHYATPVGAPEVQQAKGASHRSPHILFFALTSYTKQAMDFALAAGVALFTYDIYGDVIPKNKHARTLLDSAPRFAAERAEEEAAAAALRAKEEAAAAALRAKEEAAAAALRAKEKAEKLRVQLAEGRERVQKAAAQLESTAIISEAAIVATLELSADLVTTVKRSACTLGEITQSFILAEYTTYFRPQGNIGDRRKKRASAHRLLEILDWAMTDKLLDWNGYHVRWIRCAAEAAVRELLALYDEIAQVEKLRTISASEWAAMLCDWELREAQIDALIDEGCLPDFEDLPSAENIALRVLASLGKSSEVRSPLGARWPRRAKVKEWGEDASKVVAALDPMGLGEEATGKILNKYRGRESISTNGRGSPCYPLASSPDEIERLRRALGQPLQPGELPGPALEVPLKRIKARLDAAATLIS